MQQFRHDQLSTFGIGEEFNIKQWRSIFRQLVAMGVLIVDMENHGGIRLSKDYKNFLNDNVLLRHDPQTTKNLAKKIAILNQKIRQIKKK